MTIGISKERLEELMQDGLPGVIDFKSQCLGVIAILLRDECTDLNPWLPIDENTPKDRRILVFYPELGWQIGVWSDFCQSYSPDKLTYYKIKPTHYQELPENPKWPITNI